MSSLPFTKMHGTGNDFILINNIAAKREFTPELVRAWADRHFGVGFDQMLVVEAASSANAEFDYRIFNADGGEVEHCGNGARCFAKFVTDKGLTQNSRIRVNTASGVVTLTILDNGLVTVKMGVPNFEPAGIPFQAQVEAPTYSLTLPDPKQTTVQIGAVSIGNPHAVTLVDSVETADVGLLGPLIEAHSSFPNRVNAGFMEIIDASNIRLRVYERGVGETRACGTGACGAVAVGVRQNILQRRVKVQLSGGELEVYWPEDKHHIEMTGPCTKVFEGHIEM